MPEGVLDIGRAAFDFVDDIERISYQRLLMDRFGRELGGYGYHAWMIAGLPDPGGRSGSLAMLNGWQQGWTDLYRRRNLIRNDPIVAHCLRSTAPFEWREAPYDPLANPRDGSRQRFSHARGLLRSHPYLRRPRGHRHHGRRAGRAQRTGAAGAASDGAVAYGKAVDLCMPKRFPAAPALLTKRQREVLQWTAAGKTSWEISQILGVAESTITAHIKAAAAKYAAPNRVATVVVALRRGEISL